MKTNFFTELLKPKYFGCESFSSWMNRGLHSVRADKFVALAEYLKCEEAVRDDGIPADEVLNEMSAFLGTPVRNLRPLFYGTYEWTAEPRSRRSYCEYCAIEDIRTLGMPVIRKEWAYYWYSVCERHHCQLRFLPHTYAYDFRGIINHLTEDGYGFGLLLRDDTREKSGYLIVRRTDHYLARSAVANVAIQAQYWLRKLLYSAARSDDARSYADVVSTVRCMTKICARTYVKPYETKPFVASMMKGIRHPSCYYYGNDASLMKRTLEIDFSAMPGDTKASCLAVIGILVGVEGCVKRWRYYINCPRHELSRYYPVTDGDVFRAVTYGGVVDYRPILAECLARLSVSSRSVFRRVDSLLRSSGIA
jgi:hypothetical protein